MSSPLFGVLVFPCGPIIPLWRYLPTLPTLLQYLPTHVPRVVFELLFAVAENLESRYGRPSLPLIEGETEHI